MNLPRRTGQVQRDAAMAAPVHLCDPAMRQTAGRTVPPVQRLNHLLRSRDELLGHPKAGASWEGVMLQQCIQRVGALPEECFFWATQAGAELDLLLVRGKRRLGFEFKLTSQPTPTKSMRIAIQDLRLDRLFVVHAGQDSFPLGDGIQAIAARSLVTDVEPW